MIIFFETPHTNKKVTDVSYGELLSYQNEKYYSTVFAEHVNHA